MFGLLGLSSIKLYALLAAALSIAIGAAMLTHRFDEGRYQRLVAAQATANLKATEVAAAKQQEFDAIAVASAKREAARQAAGAALAQRQLAQVRKHVQDTRTRVPYGVVRLLDGAAGGVLADALPLPAGKSDDALSPLGWDDLARAVAGNYGNCRANAGQLDALIGTIREFQGARR